MSHLKILPKQVFLLFVITALGIQCKNQTQKEEKVADASSTEEWNLVFEEEFDSDLSQWNAWNSGAFNEEIQMYQPEQLSLENGLLTISTQRKTVSGASTVADSTTKEFEYVSGRIESKELFGPTELEGKREYKFKARIKLPNGHGMWPAFWTYGDPWPLQGEIDILEARGGKPLEFLSNLFYGTQPGISIINEIDVLHNIGQDLTKEFHVYEMIWKADSISILFDGKLLHTYQANQENYVAEFFDKKQKVVLNIAVGGWFFEDQNSANYADSAIMQVDWVRVFSR
ncbi:glycoside hydrolase family 16 protein [Croceivirga thetidis]|uniref:Glycoside hydrolase family 16 protein n=1 Tax=Croceivirga thetidis TaxID=2721623 RepID=A0ABX1GSP2_9FLAO|nr:glycoside hydrolase family 16 protein [Croceivirga thetidis]NKI32977.1 glycoside hydrolase family 16 protein [Croceivirga thetidis]